MTTEIFTKVTLGITELKVNPMQVAEHDVVCVLSRSKPAFYTVSVARMNELLSAEEQFENGYMVQKDVSVKLNYDIVEIPDADSIKRALTSGLVQRGNDIKAGDTVRIKSLDNTYKSYGYGDDMKEVSELAIVEEIDGCQVWFKLDAYSYHIDDLELIK